MEKYEFLRSNEKEKSILQDKILVIFNLFILLILFIYFFLSN